MLLRKNPLINLALKQECALDGIDFTISQSGTVFGFENRAPASSDLYAFPASDGSNVLLVGIIMTHGNTLMLVNCPCVARYFPFVSQDLSILRECVSHEDCPSASCFKCTGSDQEYRCHFHYSESERVPETKGERTTRKKESEELHETKKRKHEKTKSSKHKKKKKDKAAKKKKKIREIEDYDDQDDQEEQTPACAICGITENQYSQNAISRGIKRNVLVWRRHPLFGTLWCNKCGVQQMGSNSPQMRQKREKFMDDTKKHIKGMSLKILEEVSFLFFIFICLLIFIYFKKKQNSI